jgi:serine/threonine-protein kinase
VWEIATSGSVPREKLEACMKSPDTARKIQDDIAYAKQHHIRGTPLVVINGRDVAPAPPPFIYALVMAGGDASAKAFDLLPPPAAVEDAHAGHQH